MAVLATVKKKRLAFTDVHGFYLAEEDGVVASGMLGHDVAREVRQRAFQQRDAGCRPGESNPKAVFDFRRLLAFSKMFRNRLLVVAQDADPESPLRP